MNSRERKAIEAYKRQIATCEFIRNQEKKAGKKSELISSLRSVLSELSNKHVRIQSGIDLCIKEHTQRLEEIMRRLAENPSTEPTQFQIDESFTSLVSDSNLRLEEISKQIKFIDDLIQKVSSDSPDIEIFEHEQQIIDILSANSFFRSKDAASVQKMIDSCLNIRVCLEHLRTYSNEFLSKMTREIRVHKKNPEDFTVDPKWLELEHQKFEQLLQELSELNEEIEKRNFLFSKKSLSECIFFIESDEFPPSIFEDTRMLEDRIKEMNKRFYDIKRSFVEFVENQIDYRKAFVREVHHGKYDGSSDGENDSNYEEPIVGLRQELEDSLDRIRKIRV